MPIKTACVVFFYMQNSNFGGTSESERTGFVLICNFVINEFNLTFEVQNMENEAFQNALF